MRYAFPHLARHGAMRHGTHLLMMDEKDDDDAIDDLYQSFDDGKLLGAQYRDRFLRPVIDDPGLPYADVLVCLSTTMAVAYVVLYSGIPRPSWLTPLAGVPPIRALPFILPVIAHGSALAFCWLLGALAASAFERRAFCDSLGETLARTWRAGAFATGVLILGTQFAAYDALNSMEVPSAAADLKISSYASEVVVDVATQAFSITAFRVFRWWDAVRP